MDREAFPELHASTAGFPILRVPWGSAGGNVTVEVTEDVQAPTTPVITILTSEPTVRVRVNGKDVTLPT